MNISPNTSALMALNELKRNSNRTQKIMIRAAMGQKIANASDGAADYAISEKMRVNIRSLDQDIINVKTGNSLVGTAQSGIQEIVNNLRTIKELAINAANDTNTDADRAILQKEVSHRIDEIEDIAATTNYNGRYLLNGDYGYNEQVKGSIQIPDKEIEIVDGVPMVKSAISGVLDKFTIPSTAENVTGLKTLVGVTPDLALFHKDETDRVTPLVYMDFTGIKKADGSELDLPIDLHGEGLSLQCTTCPTYVNFVFDSTISSGESYSSAEPGRGRTDYHLGVKNLTSLDDLPKAVFDGVTAIHSDRWIREYFSGHELKVGKDANGYYLIRNSDIIGVKSCLCITAKPVGDNNGIPSGGGSVGAATTGNNKAPLIIHDGTKSSQDIRLRFNSMMPKALGIEGLEVTTQKKAEALLSRKNEATSETIDGTIDKAINYALNEATRIGSYYQRLEMDANNLTIAQENTTGAESVIRDADMASTMEEYSKYNVLSQAAQAMLGQANQNVGSKLDLLQ